MEIAAEVWSWVGPTDHLSPRIAPIREPVASASTKASSMRTQRSHPRFWGCFGYPTHRLPQYDKPVVACNGPTHVLLTRQLQPSGSEAVVRLAQRPDPPTSDQGRCKLSNPRAAQP